jgi:hypothetical protein
VVGEGANVRLGDVIVGEERRRGFVERLEVVVDWGDVVRFTPMLCGAREEKAGGGEEPVGPEWLVMEENAGGGEDVSDEPECCWLMMLAKAGGGVSPVIILLPVAAAPLPVPGDGWPRPLAPPWGSALRMLRARARARPSSSLRLLGDSCPRKGKYSEPGGDRRVACIS